jgi:hypothetical protein
MKSPAVILQLALLRADVIGDAQQHAEEDEHAGDEPQRPQGGLDLILEQQPEHDDRDAADDDEPAHLRVRVVARDASEERPEPVADDPHDVSPEEHHDRGLGADLGDGGERRTRVLRRRQELAEDAQVRARRDRQELGQALDEAEDDRLEKHGRLSALTTTDAATRGIRLPFSTYEEGR